MSALGPAQRLVLLALAGRPAGEAPLTPQEIAEVIAFRMRRRVRSTADGENVANTLRRLANRGLVEKLGTSFTNARCWAITDAGRAALKEAL